MEEIDQEHQRLFRIINKLFRFRDEEKDSQWTCQEGIKYFRGHAMKHFADEEAYMESIGYEGLQNHRRIHKGFRDNILPVLEQELEQTDYSPDAVEHFLGVCTGWLIGHTLTEDQAITGKQVSAWDSLLPEEEQPAMKKVIVQLVFDMFRLESQVISDVYGGEKFGRGVYYRLVYGAGQEAEKQEIIMVFEENLLPYEQFRKVFERKNPRSACCSTQGRRIFCLLRHCSPFAGTGGGPVRSFVV